MDMDLVTRTSAALAALGDDPVAIFRSLQERGCSGRRRDALHCPLSSFLLREVGVVASVCDHYVLAWTREDPELVDVECSPQLKRFVQLFDAGLFPAIDEAVLSL